MSTNITTMTLTWYDITTYIQFAFYACNQTNLACGLIIVVATSLIYSYCRHSQENPTMLGNNLHLLHLLMSNLYIYPVAVCGQKKTRVVKIMGLLTNYRRVGQRHKKRSISYIPQPSLEGTVRLGFMHPVCFGSQSIWHLSL